MLRGRYTDAYLESDDAPAFTADKLTAIGAPLDFVGISVYRPTVYVEPANEVPGYRTVPINGSHPKMKSGWHILDTEVLYWAPRHVHSRWNATSFYITENGCATDHVVAGDGRVYDSDRLMFLRGRLDQLQRATAEGVPVDGSFHGSVQDNLEWNAGFGNRFGMVHLDFATQQRTSKLSAQWFREASRQNARRCIPMDN